MSNKLLPFKRQTYFALALDPIHVGTGGYRLGRVDMTIVREPGTNWPKIPGTSLSGACRAYAAMQVDGKFPVCAGQGQGEDGHCGQPSCPICLAFGFSKGEQSFQGLAQISDARLVLFPVHSLAGPVWITCLDALRDWVNLEEEKEPEDGHVRVAESLNAHNRLNLGWLLLQKGAPEFSLDNRLNDVPAEIIRRAALVSSKLFGHIVNDNLEVRTSVSIDPRTGAAADKALFTYEALPRTTVLGFDVIVSDPANYQNRGQAIPLSRSAIRSTVESGLQLFESLGVGGMNTRGMGRLRVLNLANTTSSEKKQ